MSLIKQSEISQFISRSVSYLAVAFLSILSAKSQNPDDIFLQNGSFEGTPQCCLAPQGWIDCGHKGETPPDIQPSLGPRDLPLFSVTKSAFHGNTYLGMVVRENETYERVSQRLNKPLMKGKCYSFSIYLCRSDTYLSASNKSQPDLLKQFTEPVILRIWGGEAYCNQKQLLAESPVVTNIDWTKFEFEFEPKYDLNYFELEAFYKTPVLFPYNGNILLDNASHLSVIPCPTDSLYSKYKKNMERNKQKNTIIVSKTKDPSKTKSNSSDSDVNGRNKKDRILKYLDNSKVSVGQVFKIEKLYFDTDSATFQVESYTVLDELYDYLEKNKKIRIEIGGHTNNKCSEKYCERLSLIRAEAVKKYLVEKGIDTKRINCKGYGGKNPVASNSTVEGRKLNQRVEIKILSIAG